MKTLMSAEAGVVFAMPISPVTRMSAPPSTASRPVSIPTSRAWTASSALMAGPWEMSSVPRRTQRWRMGASTSWRAPTSVIHSCAPICRDNTLIAAPPAAMLAICWVVIS